MIKIVTLLLSPYTIFTQKSFLLRSLFRFQKSVDIPDEKPEDDAKKPIKEQRAKGIVKNKSLLEYLRKTFEEV